MRLNPTWDKISKEIEKEKILFTSSKLYETFTSFRLFSFLLYPRKGSSLLIKLYDSPNLRRLFIEVY